MNKRTFTEAEKLQIVKQGYRIRSAIELVSNVLAFLYRHPGKASWNDLMAVPQGRLRSICWSIWVYSNKRAFWVPSWSNQYQNWCRL